MSLAEQERKWNSVAEHMDHFHQYFKMEYNDIYTLADGSFSKRRMSLQMYLRTASQLVHHLTLHHTIEEKYLFPVLAKRMPAFEENDVHVRSHEAIHEGLDKLGALIRKYSSEPSLYSPQEIMACLDGWKEVLFCHLDDEVKDLSAENMKKHWKLEELDTIPM
ncbi:hypothetical protein BKA93DRAFT_827748 [Sparassis latifolia]